MNIFKKTTWEWWQMGELKWSLMLIGIAIGSYWADFFAPYAIYLGLVGVATSIYLATVWYKQ